MENLNKNFKYTLSPIDIYKYVKEISKYIEKSKNIHLIGISGIGMSAIAGLLKAEGKIISGSCDGENEVTDFLKKELSIYPIIGHKAKNINDDIELIIRTEAVEDDNIEIIEAKKRNIPIISYGEALSYFFITRNSIAIAGTHGKSSTTAILSWTINNIQQADFLCGAIIKKLNKNFNDCGSKLFIAEACEYKETFLNFFADTIIITSLEPDHLDYYKNSENYLTAFKRFILNLKGSKSIILRVELPMEIELAKFIEALPFKINYYFYKNLEIKNNFNPKEPDRVFYYKYSGKKNKIDSYYETEIYSDSFKNPEVLKFPFASVEYSGNITAAYIYLKSKGFSLDSINNNFKTFPGILRRFDILGFDKNNNIVLTDYAHHPGELKTLFKMLKEHFEDKKLIAIFQPHQYSRTYELFNEFVKSFSVPEVVIFYPIYRQRDPDYIINKVSHKKLSNEVKKLRDNVFYVNNPEELFQILIPYRDSVLSFIGAGDIYKIVLKYFQLYSK